MARMERTPRSAVPDVSSPQRATPFRPRHLPHSTARVDGRVPACGGRAARTTGACGSLAFCPYTKNVRCSSFCGSPLMARMKCTPRPAVREHARPLLHLSELPRESQGGRQTARQRQHVHGLGIVRVCAPIEHEEERRGPGESAPAGASPHEAEDVPDADPDRPRLAIHACRIRDDVRMTGGEANSPSPRSCTALGPWHRPTPRVRRTYRV